MTRRAWTIRFPDGTSLSGDTAPSLLAEWRRRQWHKTSPSGWREELAKRAYIWSDACIDTSLPTAAFLQELEKAGLIKIERSN
jgi:hypothetical protein